MRRAKLLCVSAAVLALGLSGCAGSAGGSTSEEADTAALSTLAEDTLGALPGVESVSVGQEPVGPNPSLDPDKPAQEIDPGDPNQWDIRISVRLEDTIDVSQAVEVGEATYEFSRAHSGGGRWVAHLTMGGGELDERDMVALPRVQTRVFPADTFPADSVRAAFAGAGIEGVTSVAVGSGWPSVTLADAEAFAPAHATLRGLPPFTEGARYSTFDGRLILVDVPERVNPEALEAIAGLAVKHPQAEFALEASYDGPRWPQLYVNRIAQAELDGLLATLNDPALADADPEGYPLEYFVRSFTDAGSVDTGGALGGVPVP